MTRLFRGLGRAFASPALASIVSLLAPLPAAAQEPAVLTFCYGSLTGVVYRIKAPSTPSRCYHSTHVEFSITDGVGALRADAAAGGDLTGVLSNLTVSKLQGSSLSIEAPTSGQVLMFNGTAWTPGATSGASGPAGGVLAGSYPNPTFANGMITAAAIAPEAVRGTHIADASLTEVDLEFGAITGGEGGRIRDGTVTAHDIAENTITAAKIGSAAVGSDELGSNAVDVQHIRDGSVINQKLAPQAVTDDKVAPGQLLRSLTVGGAALRDNVTLAAGSNVTITSAGQTVTINATGGGGGATASDVSCTACVDATDLADGAVSNGKLQPLTQANLVANSATTATAQTVGGTIMSRDAAGGTSLSRLNVGDGGINSSGNVLARQLSVTGNATVSELLSASGGVRLLSTNARIIDDQGQTIMLRSTGPIPSMFLGTGGTPSSAGPPGNFVAGSNSGGALTTGGVLNVLVGHRAGATLTVGRENVAIGEQPLPSATSAAHNVAVGSRAAVNLQSGDRNVFVGMEAGALLQSGSNNIFLGARSGSDPSIPDESNAIYLGSSTHTKLHAPAAHANIGTGTGLFISNGRIGTVGSSGRFKLEVRELGDESRTLFSLRPVSFRYRPEIDRSGSLQYGLIAEEVDRVAPHLIERDSTGRPYTVRYHLLVPMLLNELQLLERHRQVQEARLAEYERRLARLEAVLNP
ncbi:MAG: tail fiber domain-containing protein [Gemmatimonadaceae bacterium]